MHPKDLLIYLGALKSTLEWENKPSSVAIIEEALTILRPLAAGKHVIVPFIATDNMLVAAEDALCGVACGDLAHDIAGDVYSAMLAAAKATP